MAIAPAIYCNAAQPQTVLYAGFQNPDATVFLHMVSVKQISIIRRKYGEFLAPTVLMCMSITIAYVLNSILVGHLLGTEQMAAINTILPIFQTYSIIAILIGTGASSEMAIAMGCGDKKKADAIYAVALIALVLFATAGLLLQIVFFDNLVFFVTNGASVTPLAKEYYGRMLWCTVFYVISIGITYLVRIDGKAGLSSWVIILSNSVVLAADFVMIKFMGMGVEASGIAMIIGYLSGVLLVFPDIARHTKHLGAILSDGMKKTGRTLWRISRTGWPAALISLLVSLKIFAINILAEHLTDNSSGIAIFTVCLMCWSFISIFTMGSAMTLSPIVGVLYGEQDYARIRGIFKYSMKILMAVCSALVMFIILFPDIVLFIFGIDSPQLITLGRNAVRLFALSLLGTSFIVLTAYFYMSVGKIKLASGIQALEVALVIPLAYLLGYMLGFMGIWLAFLAAELITVGVLFLYAYAKDRRKNRNGRYGILQIPYSEPAKVADLSVEVSIKGAITASEKIYDSILKRTSDELYANKAAVAVEEYIAAIAKNTGDRDDRAAVDIRVSDTDEKISIALRDNSKCAVNPAINLAGKGGKDIAEDISYISIASDTDGGWLVRRLSESIETNNVLGLNNTVIIIDKRRSDG